MLGLEEFNNLYKQEAKKLYIEMINANRSDELDAYLGKSKTSINNNDSVLIFGYSQVSSGIIKELCKCYGFNENNIDIKIDKKSIKGFDCQDLFSTKYSLVVLGEIPHKLRNIECKNSGILGDIYNNKNKYKNVFVARNKQRVRITKDSLEEVLISNMQTCLC